jgi:hypothetical protein
LIIGALLLFDFANHVADATRALPAILARVVLLFVFGDRVDPLVAQLDRGDIMAERRHLRPHPVLAIDADHQVLEGDLALLDAPHGADEPPDAGRREGEHDALRHFPERRELWHGGRALQPGESEGDVSVVMGLQE